MLTGKRTIVHRLPIPGLLALALLLAACGEPLATPEPVLLQASGSMTLAPLVTDLADAFHERAPTVTVAVTGLGTQFGLESLRSAETDIALASYLLPGVQERWRTTAIARDGIAIIAHPSNPIEGLGLLQLQDLFGGRAYEWAAVGGPASLGEVRPVSREEGSGTRAAFEALVMIDWAVTPMAVLVPSPEAVVDYVAEHPGAIGYVSMAAVTPQVKVLKVEGALPTPESASQGSYPLSHELWLVTGDPQSEAVGAFVDFVLSAAGQEIVGRQYGRVR
ncbi:MAG: phosphate ABC transporter substrate-binding protein [Anaerolineae bacterium]|nr:phosphate ABC transporter substrate-binding protein [Anaerolineae bacterium]